MSNFRRIDRDTGFLMPPSVDEWLSERDLARFASRAGAGGQVGHLPPRPSASRAGDAAVPVTIVRARAYN
jgi:hypothetical protein